MGYVIENFEYKLYRLPKKKGATQKELANKLGVNVQSVSNVEEDKS